MTIRITGLTAHDIRFPTSRMLDGSDAMNPDPDYSAAYVVLTTDHAQGLAGHGMTFTIGRGNDLCVAAIEALRPLVVGLTVEQFAARDLRERLTLPCRSAPAVGVDLDRTA